MKKIIILIDTSSKYDVFSLYVISSSKTYNVNILYTG